MNLPPVLAVDFGGTEIKLGIVAGADVLTKRNIPAHSAEGLCSALPRVEDAFEQCFSELAIDTTDLLGCGIAFAGLVDGENCKVIGTDDKYPDAASVNLSDWAEQRWGLSLVLDNDARMAAVGEWQFGAGQGVDDLVVVTLGTGIGTGVILAGDVLVGRRFRAGSLGGHIPLSVDADVLCHCGNRACSEALASTWALRRDMSACSLEGSLAGYDPDTVGYREVFAAARAGDKEATHFANRAIDVWSTLTVALIHAYDPDRVVLTGNVMKSGDMLLPKIRRYVDKHAWTPGFSVQIEQGILPATAALLGAGFLARRSINPD